MAHQLEKSFAPAADIHSTDKPYKSFISVPDAGPGVELSYEPNNRELQIAGTLLRSAELAALSPEDLAKVLVHEERPVGKFKRTLGIPGQDEVNYKFMDTLFNNGVLVVTILKGPVTDVPPGRISIVIS